MYVWYISTFFYMNLVLYSEVYSLPSSNESRGTTMICKINFVCVLFIFDKSHTQGYDFWPGVLNDTQLRGFYKFIVCDRKAQHTYREIVDNEMI